MSLADHGTRRRYRQGCRCLTCRAANATYEHARATYRRTGRMTARCRLEAGTTWTQIRWLLREGYTKSDLAHALGRRRRWLTIGRHQAAARTVALIGRLYRSQIDPGTAGQNICDPHE